jgi:hypothetical protein
MPCYTDPNEGKLNEKYYEAVKVEDKTVYKEIALKIQSIMCGMGRLLSKDQIKSIQYAWDRYVDHVWYDLNNGDQECKEAAKKEIERLNIDFEYELSARNKRNSSD